MLIHTVYYIQLYYSYCCFYISATEYHLGTLKAKLAKYRTELMEPAKKGEKGEGFEVLKSGDARVAMIGFPSVGKSTLLSAITKTESEQASYEFTTLTCIPGVIEYKAANIQLLDLPGIIEGAAQGKGRGRQVIAVARLVNFKFSKLQIWLIYWVCLELLRGLHKEKVVVDKLLL